MKRRGARRAGYWGEVDWHAHGLPTLEELKEWKHQLETDIEARNAAAKDGNSAFRPERKGQKPCK